jgi:hypothetical protein
MAPNEKLTELSGAGVAVWLDDLSRDRIHSGDLQSLVDDYSVVGITTNPAILAAAISASGVLRSHCGSRRSAHPLGSPCATGVAGG